MATIQAISTIFFAILLNGLGHFVYCWQQPAEQSLIQQFSKWLEVHLISNPYDLPFTMNDYVFHDLERTTKKFQSLTVKYGLELENPATALNKAIFDTFDSYKKNKCDKKKLNEIKKGDPVGFNVYWNRVHVSRDFATCVEIFYGTMCERIRLLNFKQDPRYSKYPDNAIATEYSNTPDSLVNQFLDIVGRELNKEMIPVNRSGFDHNYEDIYFNDVQILAGKQYNEKRERVMHATCIYYKAGNGTVYIYEKPNVEFEDEEIAFIKRRYPNCVIKYAKPSFIQNDDFSCAIFAMTYATLLLKGKDPIKYKVRLNKVNGDETLYMRLHIMEMLTKNKLFLPKLEKIK